MTDHCFVCDREPHPDTDHAYWSTRDALAEHARQPNGTPYPLTVEGVTATYSA